MSRKVSPTQKIGAFVEDFEFNWRRWRQPPGTLGQIDPCQLWAVEVSAAALEQSGYDGETKDFDRSKCGVIFANALGGENRNLSNISVVQPHQKRSIKAWFATSKCRGIPSRIG